MARGGYYAVAKGRREGIFTSWEEAEQQVNGFSGAKYQRFATRQSAEEFLSENAVRVPGMESQEADEEADEVQGEAADEDISGLSASLSALSTTDASEPIASKYQERSETAATERPDPRDQATLVAFCDGSGLNNGEPDCRGGFAALFPHNPSWNVAKEIKDGERATNERADYYAALAAMERANEENPEQDQAPVIFTNHQNVIDSMTLWSSKWCKNGWRKGNGDPVKNRDLFERLLSAEGERRIVWAFINAKNEMSAWEKEWSGKADRVARNAAQGTRSAVPS